MLNDNVMIVHKLPRNLPEIHLYMIGDRHIGSSTCDLDRLQTEVRHIANDPLGYVVYCGDMLDFGIKTAKTNTYTQTLMPHEQKECFADLYAPLAKRTLAATPGNHCRRGMIATGINPMYDVFCRWGIEDVYREGVAIVKVNVGEKQYNHKQVSYCGVVSHGSSTHKHHKWAMSYDGADFFVSGHTHTPSYTPRGKIRIDPRNEVIRRIGYKEIVVDSGLEYGDYASVNEYEVSAPPETQMLILSGTAKRISFLSEEQAV